MSYSRKGRSSRKKEIRQNLNWESEQEKVKERQRGQEKVKEQQQKVKVKVKEQDPLPFFVAITPSPVAASPVEAAASLAEEVSAPPGVSLSPLVVEGARPPSF